MQAKQVTLSLALAAGALAANAQLDPCATWNDLSAGEKDAVENAHMFYRDKIKAGDMEAAMPLWKEAYDKAPAADGKRPFHYIDGRALYLDLYKNATTDVEKGEYAAQVAKLYEQERQCYPGSEAQSLGMQVYDMFYTMQRPYAETYPVAVEAMEVGGDETDFRVITPVGYLVPYMYSNELIDAEEARQRVEQARAIVAANQDGPNAADYAAAQEAADASIVTIERNIFDCDYFKAKLEPAYRENPDDPEVWKSTMTQLVQSGCLKEDPLVAELISKTRAYEQTEYEKNNPVTAAKKMIEAGDMKGGMAKLEEVAMASEPDKKAALLLNMASLYREQNQYSTARKYANMAAQTKPGWGKPYIMIGDMYASSSRSCSEDPFNQRLVIIAAINKYRQAARDPETKSTANSRISKYSSSLPTTEMLFERGLKPGETKSTGCWIGETVTLQAS